MADPDSLETRVAVTEQRLALMNDTVCEIKDNMVRQSDLKVTNERLAEIKELIAPRIQKIDSVYEWKATHIQDHNKAEERKQQSVGLWIGFGALLLTAFEVPAALGLRFYWKKKNGHGD